MEPFVVQAVTSCKQIQYLDSILLQKVDPVTQKKLVTESVFEKFWNDMFTIFGARMKSLPPAVRNMFSTELPALSQILQWRLVDAVNNVSFAMGKRLLHAIEDLHQQYVSASAMRVTEPVNLMLPQTLAKSLQNMQHEQLFDSSLPTQYDLRRYIQILNQEVIQVENSATFLVNQIVKNVRQSIVLFVERIDSLVDPTALAPHGNILSPLSGGHQRNIKLFVFTSIFYRLLGEGLTKPSIGETRVISPQLWTHVANLQKKFIEQMYMAISQKFEVDVYPKWRDELLKTASDTHSKNPKPCLIKTQTVSHPLQRKGEQHAQQMENFVVYLNAINQSYLQQFTFKTA